MNERTEVALCVLAASLLLALLWFGARWLSDQLLTLHGF